MKIGINWEVDIKACCNSSDLEKSSLVDSAAIALTKAFLLQEVGSRDSDTIDLAYLTFPLKLILQAFEDSVCKFFDSDDDPCIETILFNFLDEVKSIRLAKDDD